MKPIPFFLLAAALSCGCGGAVSAQTSASPAKEIKPSVLDISIVPDGIVFYKGRTFLIRNERAVLVDAVLVPEGQVLTPEGRLVMLPTDFSNDISPSIREGLFAVRGQAFLIRQGRMMRVDAKLVPEGRVLTADGRIVPLPSDFSGFVQDRAADGSVLGTPAVISGPQVLPGQAGVPQVEQGQAVKK